MSERSWRDSRRAAEQALAAAGVVNAASEARWICEHVSGHEGVEWAEVERRAPTARQVARLQELLGRRCAGVPLQYVLGGWPFRSLDLLVDPRVLIPRAETEWVVELALCAAPHPGVAVDLGTGSGAIALSLARELDGVMVHATDVSGDALAVARLNGAGNGIGNVTFHEGDWYAALPETLTSGIGLIVSNPPYVAETERSELPREVVDHEPLLALLAGADGLDAIRCVVGEARGWLRPGGVLVVEHGAAQRDAVIGLAHDAGLVEVRDEADLAGRARVLIARAP
jgi:release factor glutamine methyltransferase